MKKWEKKSENRLNFINKSEDEVDELLTVRKTLSTQNVKEDEDDGIFSNVAWVLDDFVSDQKDGSDILETV